MKRQCQSACKIIIPFCGSLVDNMAGRGGYAEVYKGTLADGHLVAVKRLAKGTPSEQKEKEFLAELGIQGHVCHPNTSYLLGCCVENGLYLIFEFCTNGTLASALHGTAHFIQS
jgi:serine/threonine protein kinase